MAAEWTTDQVLSLAPDSSSAQAGKGLASTRHWSNLGRNDSAAWGECKGSGAKPYQVRADLEGPVFKCTCPSRKFPCKHSLGLLLVLAQDKNAFKEGDPPGWVAEWLESRADRAQKKAERAAEAKPPDPEQQAKRQAQRAERIDQGIEEASLWIRDLARHGLAWSQGQPTSFWTGMAARMVDAQAPGLGRRIRDMALTPASGEGWHERLLEQLTQLHLLIQAWRRLDRLDTALQEDVRAAVGFVMPKETVLAQSPVDDIWAVLAQDIDEDDDGIRTQRLFLWGRQTKRPALILSFAHRTAAAFDFSLPVGGLIEGVVVYYPSAVPLRAIVKEHQVAPGALAGISGYGSISSILDAYANALAANPWCSRFPALVEPVQISREGDTWIAVDRERRCAPLRLRDLAGWHALAVTGGKECALFGEWDGEWLETKSIVFGGQVISLG